MSHFLLSMQVHNNVVVRWDVNIEVASVIGSMKETTICVKGRVNKGLTPVIYYNYLSNHVYVHTSYQTSSRSVY